jgi:hypothetical protein
MLECYAMAIDSQANSRSGPIVACAGVFAALSQRGGSTDLDQNHN